MGFSAVMSGCLRNLGPAGGSGEMRSGESSCEGLTVFLDSQPPSKEAKGTIFQMDSLTYRIHYVDKAIFWIVQTRP